MNDPVIPKKSTGNFTPEQLHQYWPKDYDANGKQKIHPVITVTPASEPGPEVTPESPKTPVKATKGSKDKGLSKEDLTRYASMINEALATRYPEPFFKKNMAALVRMEGLEEIAALSDKKIKVILEYVHDTKQGESNGSNKQATKESKSKGE